MQPSPDGRRPDDPSTGADPDLDLLAVGALFLDVLYGPLPSAPRPGTEIFTPGAELAPGGIANFAIAAAALGASTAIQAPIGDGPASRLVRDALGRAGIADSHLRCHAGEDLPVTAALAYDGDRALVTGGKLARTEPVPIPVHAARSIALHLDIEEMPGLADTRSAVFADVGWDPTGVWDRSILRHLEHCRGFLPNADEAMAYTGTSDALTAARTLADRVPIVVVTCGAEGAVAVDAGHGTEAVVPAARLGPMDPTGAGDTFGAALITLLDRGLVLADATQAAGLAATARGTSSFGPFRAATLPQLTQLARDLRLPVAEELAALAASA